MAVGVGVSVLWCVGLARAFLGSRSLGVRSSEAERVLWGEAARAAGLSRNAWVRRALSDAARLELAQALERVRVGEARERVRRLAFPQEG